MVQRASFHELNKRFHRYNYMLSSSCESPAVVNPLSWLSFSQRQSSSFLRCYRLESNRQRIMAVRNRPDYRRYASAERTTGIKSVVVKWMMGWWEWWWRSVCFSSLFWFLIFATVCLCSNIATVSLGFVLINGLNLWAPFKRIKTNWRSAKSHCWSNFFETDTG